MSNTSLKRILTPALAVIAATAALAGGLNAANAATPATITLNAAQGETLAGHTFDVYRLGSYADPTDPDNNGKVNTVNVTGDDTTNPWITAALGASNPVKPGMDAAGTLASITDAATLKSIATDLAGSDAKPEAALTRQTSDKNTITLNLPDQGLYLIVDSAGLPIIVGTQIDGKDLENQALGVAVIKSTAISVDKNGDGDTTIGQTVSYTAQSRIPDKNANPTKLSYTDSPVNLAIDHDSIKVKIGDGEPTAVPAEKITWNKDGGFTFTADSYLTDQTYGKTVTISYSAQVTGKDPHNTGTIKATIDGQDKTDSDEVTLANFDFTLKKTKSDQQETAVPGAGFVIRNKAGKYLKLDAATGKWTYIDAKDAAAAKTAGAERLTGQDGTLAFDGLGDGEYTVEESTVPTGFLPTPAAFTVTIKDGKAQVAGTGLNNGLTTAQKDMAENGTVKVKNLDSPSQLAQTGAAGILLIVTMTAVLAGGSAAAWSLKRRNDTGTAVAA